MMEWLSDWVKQVMIVIMLAAFVDLMMPNNGLQRYVRTVLGLFVLLVLLTPIFTLFQKSMDTQKLTASIEQLPAIMGRITTESVGVANMKPLETVMQEGNQLRTVNELQAVQLLETRLASELSSSMETINGVRVREVDVELQVDHNGKPTIKKMLAVLHHIERVEDPTGADYVVRNSNREIEPVTPVKPVHIQVQIGNRQAEAGARTEMEQQQARLSELELQARTQIYELLTQQWQLKRDQVQLYYESEQR